LGLIIDNLGPFANMTLWFWNPCESGSATSVRPGPFESAREAETVVIRMEKALVSDTWSSLSPQVDLRTCRQCGVVRLGEVDATYTVVSLEGRWFSTLTAPLTSLKGTGPLLARSRRSYGDSSRERAAPLSWVLTAMRAASQRRVSMRDGNAVT
jgi:hypothetical protein